MFLLSMAVALALFAGAESGSFLTYDSQARQLHFQCPWSGNDDDHVLLALLNRLPEKGGNTTLLASWEVVNTDPRARGVSFHTRVTIPDRPTKTLKATLNNVTCHDALAYSYQCLTTVQNNSHYENPGIYNFNQRFQFTGAVSRPYISQEPMKSRYDEGDLLSLTCSAAIGSADNGIVWETGFPGGNFFLVTGEKDPVTGKENEETQREDNECNRHSYSSLKYPLRAEDDGKVFQCRLRKTHQKARIIVAVRTGREGCTASDGMGRVESAAGGQERAVRLQVNNPKAGKVTGRQDEDGEGGPNLMMIGLIVILLVTVIVVVVSVVIVKRHRKKLQPLVVIESPDSSESGYSGRQLPNLPYLTSGRDHENTRPKWIDSSRQEDSHTHPSDLTSASIYVSMTGLDTMGRPKRDGALALDAQAPMPLPPEGEEREQIAESRLGRSESVYSNQETRDDESLTVGSSFYMTSIKNI